MVEESGILEGCGITNTHSVGRRARCDSRVAGLSPGSAAVGFSGRGRDLRRRIERHQWIPRQAVSRHERPRQRRRRGGYGRQRRRWHRHDVPQIQGGHRPASRVLASDAGGYTVGVLVQCNFGARQDLRVAGVPIGEEITDLRPCVALDDSNVPPKTPRCGKEPNQSVPRDQDQGSIIVVVATDAPLLPHQLKRIATRVALGVARTGGFGGNSSGDIFLASRSLTPGPPGLKASTASTCFRTRP